MRSSASVVVRAPRPVVWSLVTDIEHAAGRVKGIEKVEVLARPPSGLVGFTWRETRTMFGKEAVATMGITEAVEGSHYVTRSEEQGMVYTMRVAVADAPGGTRLSMDFAGAPQTFGAKVMAPVFGLFMKGTLRKALEKDLADLKAAAEAQAPAAPHP